MAEGICNALRGDEYTGFSAGIETHGLNPWAVKVMKEIGIDISGSKSKTVDDLGETKFDCVITVCGNAEETCPVFPGTTRMIHRGFDDPPRLAAELSSEEEILTVYRRVRDQIIDFIKELPGILSD